MHRFKKILLVTDSSDRSLAALKRAAALARRNRAHLTVVNVLEALPRDLQRLCIAVDPDELWKIGIEEKTEALQSFVARLPQDDLSLSTQILCGTPFLEIIREVLRNQHDLVITTAEGGVKDALFGSTSMHLMRKCPCPVWVVHPADPEHPARVLAAVDPMAEDHPHQSLNLKILQLAAGLADLGGKELHVVHAWLPVTERISFLERVPHLKPEPDSVTRQIHEVAFNQLLQKCDLQGLQAHFHLVQGEAGNAIPQIAEEKQVDVIVMGTVCRTGVAGLFIGNTAENVLSQVKCSVLTLKPEGFVTPVTL